MTDHVSRARVQYQARSELDLRAAPRRSWLALAPVLVLAGLLAAGAILRLDHLNWDRNQHVHPDERYVVWVADTMRWPQDLRAALDPRVSPLNPFRWPPGSGDQAGRPRDYAYGHFPLYLLVGVAHGLQALALLLARAGLSVSATWLHLAQYEYLALVGRAISALCDLGTVLLVFFLARRLYSPAVPRHGAATNAWGEANGLPSPSADTITDAGQTDHSWLGDGTAAGLVAAGAYAVAVLPVQLSHFTAVDLVLTFCVVASVTMAVRAAEQGGRSAWLGAGALAGLAVGSKFSAVLLAAPLVVASVYRLPERDTAPGPVSVIVRRWGAMLLAALATFLITNPFAVLDLRAYLNNIATQNAMVAGVLDAPYMRQYAGTAPYWYLVQQLSQWGLGWPLGLAAWAGFGWAIVQAGRHRATPAQVIALAWALPYFAITGPMYAKFLRYSAPLLPFLLIFAAGAALALRRLLVARVGRRGVVAWVAVLACIAAFTVGWTLTFTGVYRQEHPWIQASRWIYAHIPAGSKLLNEQWDDALPLALDDLPGRSQRLTYRQVQLPLYERDTQAKLDGLVSELSSADYIILATNRLAGPIQRLPIRYPMSSHYYRLLFDGSLGYTPVAEFTAYPQLGPLVVADDHADESFSVYDHPHTRIFANTGRLSAGLLRTRLGRYLPLGSADAQFAPALPRVTAGRAAGLAAPLPLSGAAAEPPPPLTLSQPVDTLPLVADFRWNGLASHSPPLAVVLWWLTLSVFGWAAWPLLFPVLGGLRDRGYGVARVLGWLLIGWVNWLGASLGAWQNRLPVIAAWLALLILAGVWAWRRQRTAIGRFLAGHGRLVLLEEGVFALAFCVGAGVRLLNPDLWQPWNGGEKFMEFAFLNAILRSPTFPPYDPYFAGGFINYYYYGLYLVSLPIKLTGIVPEVAFNLAVPGLFALTTLALFSVGANLAGRARHALRGGLLAVLLGLLMANLSSFQQVFQKLGRVAGTPPNAGPLAALLAPGRGLGALLGGAHWPGFDYWAASRVIPFSINEFPLWSFLFADLHPHLIAMPLAVTVVGLALAWLLGRTVPRQAGTGEATSDSDPVEQPAAAAEVALTGTGAAGQARLERRVVDTAVLPSDVGADGSGAGGLEEDLTPRPSSRAGNGEERAASVGMGEEAASSVGMGEEAAPSVGKVEQLAAPATMGEESAAPGGRWEQATSVPEWDREDASGQPGDGEQHALPETGADEDPPVAASTGWPGAAWHLALLVLVLGALGAGNTWDLPVYFLVVVGVFWLAARRARRILPSVAALALGGAVAALAVLAYAPFYMHYQAQVGGQTGSYLERFLGTVRSGSPLQPWLKLWAPALFLGSSFVLWALLRTPGNRARRVVMLLAAIGLSAILFMLDRPAAALAALPLVVAFGLLFASGLPARTGMALLLYVVGLGTVAGTELFYLRDFLSGGDWYRMNTLFKFGISAWLLLALAGSLALPRVWTALGRGADWLAPLWRTLAVALLAAGLFFLPFGVPERLDDRFPGARPPIGTLDGSAYMTVGSYSWPNERHVIQLRPEYDAIHWLLDHVNGTPVVAEAPAGEYVVDGAPAAFDYYRAGGLQVASLTGFPTFVGQHQYEQRPGDQVSARARLGQEFFNTPSLARTRALLSTLHVDYIYVGALERLLFPPASLAKFDQLVADGDLAVAYHNAQVAVYQVVRR